MTAGPFADMVVNLGPVALDLTNASSVGTGPVTPDQFAWNPRCLKRDLSDAVNRRYANASGVAALILGSEDVERFQMTMQGVPGSGSIGVHGGGHYSIGESFLLCFRFLKQKKKGGGPEGAAGDEW